VQQLYAQDTCLYVSRRSCKLQIEKFVNMIINRTLQLSGRGLCVGPITRAKESYQLWYVPECDHGT